jgi:hypothetical protein
MALRMLPNRSKLNRSSPGESDGTVRRTASFACALALIGVGSYLLLRIFLTVAQHAGSHGRLGIVAAVITALGGYLLWADFIKAPPNG